MSRTLLAIAMAIAVAAACDGGSPDVTLSVRTTLPQELARSVEASFEGAYPGVDVRVTRATARESLEELLGSADPPFDVWWGAPAVSLEQAAVADVLTSYRPSWIGSDTGEGQARVAGAADDLWHALLVTPFVIAFNSDTLTLTRAPTDWIDVFHFRWSDEIGALDPVRTWEGAYFTGAMIVQSLRAYQDPTPGFDWLARLDDQVPEYSGSAQEVIRDLGRKEALLGILPRAAVEQARSTDSPWIYYRLPESGTPLLVLGVAITRESLPASQFVDHLGSLDVATESRLLTHWLPAYGDVDAGGLPADFELEQRWTSYPLAIDTLAAELDDWVDRWDLELRGR